MATARVNLQVDGRQVDLSGDIPDETVHRIVETLTALLLEPTVPDAGEDPEG